MNLLDGSEPSLLTKLTEAGIHQNKYEDLQDLFYSKVFADSLDVMRAVRELDLDVEKLLADKDDPITKSRILSEDQQANKWQIYGTPSFVINGNLFVGFNSYAEFMKNLSGYMVQ